jgi:hypothetical protein
MYSGAQIRFGHTNGPDDSFPLTPALSLGEREVPGSALGSIRSRRPYGSDPLRKGATVLPLPEGEGWGEGNGRTLARGESSNGGDKRKCR